jgi:predicted regulator of Ras-like GTPase activity (Roadblock/LC7/MglB family)
VKEVLEPLASIPGVQTAILVTSDGVPIAAEGKMEGDQAVEPEPEQPQTLSTREPRAPRAARIEDSDGHNALAGLGASWLAEVTRTIAPLSWDSPQYMMLRAARGTLMIMQAPNAFLLVLLDGGVRAEDVRLPMEAAVARMQRVLRGIGKPSEDKEPAGVSPASSESAQPGEYTSIEIPGLSGEK